MAKRFFNGKAREIIAGFHCDSTGKVFPIIKGFRYDGYSNTDDTCFASGYYKLLPSHISGSWGGDWAVDNIKWQDGNYLSEPNISKSNEMNIYFDCSSIPDNAIITYLEIESYISPRTSQSYTLGHCYSVFKCGDLSIDIFTVNDNIMKNRYGQYTVRAGSSPSAIGYVVSKRDLRLTKQDLENAYVTISSPHEVAGHYANHNLLRVDYVNIRAYYKIN